MTYNEFTNLSYQEFWIQFGHLTLLQISKQIDMGKRVDEYKKYSLIWDGYKGHLTNPIAIRHTVRGTTYSNIPEYEELQLIYARDELRYKEIMTGLNVHPKPCSKL